MGESGRQMEILFCNANEINDDGDADDDDSESSLDVRRLVMIAPNPDRERVSIRSFGNHVPFSIAIPVGLYSNP